MTGPVTLVKRIVRAEPAVNEGRMRLGYDDRVLTSQPVSDEHRYFDSHISLLDPEAFSASRAMLPYQAWSSSTSNRQTIWY